MRRRSAYTGIVHRGTKQDENFCHGTLNAVWQTLRCSDAKAMDAADSERQAFGVERARPSRMSTAHKFEDLAAWRFCREMEDVIFEITQKGPVTRDREFWNQIRAAASKAPPLIAEGFIRFKPRQFAYYLRMARGEIAEVQSKLASAKARKYFTEEQLSGAAQTTKRAMGTTTNLLKAKLRQIGEL